MVFEDPTVTVVDDIKDKYDALYEAIWHQGYSSAESDSEPRIERLKKLLAEAEAENEQLRSQISDHQKIVR